MDLGPGAAGQVADRAGEGLVQGGVRVPEAFDAGAVAQGLVERRAQHEGAVLRGVVVVDLQVSLAGEFEVEAGVAREGIEHVIEEADPGGDLARARTVQVEDGADAGLLGLAADGGGARCAHERTSGQATSRAARRRSKSFAFAGQVMRTARPKERIAMPSSATRARSASAAGVRAWTKFP